MFNWEDALKKLIVYLEQLCGDIILISPNDFTITEFDNRQIMTIDIFGKGIELYFQPIKHNPSKFGVILEIELYQNIREGVDIAAVIGVGVQTTDTHEIMCYHTFTEIAALLRPTSDNPNHFN